ncbi:MAG: hypothetical protein ACRD20_16865 [Terriglobales bacterium]
MSVEVEVDVARPQGESQGVEEMKTSKHRRITPLSSSAAFEREVRREIEHFQRAVNSYADRFAREPHLSFEQHWFRLAATNRLADGEERRRS